MKPALNMPALLLCLLPLLWAASPAVGEESPSSVTRVMLKSTVRLDAEAAPVTLGDLARITGPQSETLQALAIDPGGEIVPGDWSLIGLDAIRAQLDSAGSVNDGSLVVAGTDIRITRRTNTRPATEGKVGKDAPPAGDSGPVLRDHIERWVYARLGTTADTTRIQYNDRDRDLLDTPTAGRIVEIGELGRSERMSLRIAIYENERIIEDTTIRFDLQIHRMVRVAQTQIRRNSGISEEATSVETRWLPPTTPIADPQRCLGQVCKSTIDPGSILLVPMLEPPVVIGRGEIVSASSLAGSVSVSLSVRALSDGKMGELIELESRDRKQRFTARVAGPGRVVIVNNP